MPFNPKWIYMSLALVAATNAMVVAITGGRAAAISVAVAAILAGGNLYAFWVWDSGRISLGMQQFILLTSVGMLGVSLYPMLTR